MIGNDSAAQPTLHRSNIPTNSSPNVIEGMWNARSIPGLSQRIIHKTKICKQLQK